MTTKPGHILVVDDNRMNRIKLSYSLEQQGHTVALAETGQRALEMLNDQSFDLVLLDIIMPGMDGYAVLERIKSDSRLKNIPVIVISAVDETDSAVRCIEMGAEDYLPKPFDPVILRARLSASIEKKKLRDLEVAYLQQEVMLRQSEKLATLGKLSAGMAHEINNPAAAALRGAVQSRTALAQFVSANLRLAELKLASPQLDALLALDTLAQQHAVHPVDLAPLLRADQEQALESWLEHHGIENAWDYAPVLVSMGYTTDELAVLADTFTPPHLACAVAWLSSISTIYNLVEEIAQGAARITSIVNALKTYTYLDQAPLQLIDVHDGLDNTLVMLRSKLKTGITVHREYAIALPRIQAYASELNQVWTNIIDNAADAMQGHGEIVVRTRQEGRWAVVQIEDQGPGIPEAIQSKIFDPFFTTKPPGQGTGLGLNISHNIIVHKHRGTLAVTSMPGKTCFEIKLPITAEPSN